MKKKICIIIGSAMNLNSLYKDQFKFLEDNGYKVTGVAPKGVEHEWLNSDGITTKIIHLKRKPSIFHDIVSLCQLWWYLLFNRFDIVSISTPKASFIGALAAFFSIHKNVIYTLRGRAYENTKGFTRAMFEFIEKIICSISVKVFCISHEIRNDFIDKNICSENKIFVIGSGSSNGVDLDKFKLDDQIRIAGKRIRRDLNLMEDSVLILYSGRIRKDKGINELVKAFEILQKNNKNTHLLIQGEFEYFDPLEETVMNIIDKNQNISLTGWEKDIEKFLAAADIFAFPSHREGFGNVAIEASAMFLPVVGFDVVGCRESIKDGFSGLLCRSIDSMELAKTIEKLLVDKKLRIQLGVNGRNRVEEEFDSKYIWNELLNVYNDMV